MGSHPKYALARAEELIRLGNEKQAHKLLRSFTNRRKDWSKSLEHLMLKFVELSVSLDKAKEARDPLNVFRYICQLQHSLSLDNVLRRFISLSEELTEYVFFIFSSMMKLVIRKSGLTTYDLIIPF